MIITCRREHLDRILESKIPDMTGKVLDIGGRKIRRRGRFQPPLHQVSSWVFLNSDPTAEPDILASAEALPVSDGDFDRIVMTEVLEYLGKPQVAIHEIYRVLAPGGIAFISVPLLTPIHGDWEQDRQRWTSFGLRELCVNAGFQSPEVQEMGGLGSVIFDLLDAATGYASSSSFLKKVLRKFIFWGAPLFFLSDRFFGQTRFITTGYFLTLKK